MRKMSDSSYLPSKFNNYMPSLEAMIPMPKGKGIKEDFFCKRELEKAGTHSSNLVRVLVIIQRSLPKKEGDPGSFTLPCLIGPLVVKNALDDLGASINLMPHSLFCRLGISELKPTRMSIQLADRSIKYLVGLSLPHYLPPKKQGFWKFSGTIKGPSEPGSTSADNKGN
ncbi:putative reverse transcriptase domain-containing protein [Tanacetum coccineum]